MDLILWRHAHAGESLDDPIEDLKRPLSAKGERQALRMAEWLSLHLPESTRVLASPAVRTQQTALALGRRFRTVDALAPGAGADDVIGAVKFPSGRGAVLVVGHQPTLGLVAARLLGTADPSIPVSIRKAGVWWWRCRVREGRQEVTLQAVIGPDQV